MTTARFALYVLAEVVVKNAFQVLYAGRLDLRLQAQTRQLVHAMRQQSDAHADLLDVGHGFKYVAREAALIQRQGKAQAAYAATDDGDVCVDGGRAYSEVMALRLITWPQRGSSLLTRVVSSSGDEVVASMPARPNRSRISGNFRQFQDG